MGFHICPFCKKPTDPRKYSNLSSGDVTLRFMSGRDFMMPDMVLHYVVDHGYLPPVTFIAEVMDGEIVTADRWQTKGIVERIAYLEDENFEKGEVPFGFVEKLEQLMLSSAPPEDRELYRKMLYSK